jgi:hypothetical protein
MNVNKMYVANRGINAENLGFVQTANRGMAWTAEKCKLLKSDTILCLRAWRSETVRPRAA